ncbi:nucleotide sugar dehydrogenase [Chloroflexota bacterium]
MQILEHIEEKIRNKSAIIGVIGLGYVGLPLAVAFSESGFKVLGFDIQQSRVDMVKKGLSYIGDVTNDRLLNILSSRHFDATTDQDRLNELDAICICVPTPLTRTKEPDLSYVENEAEQISGRLRQQQLIVLESTTYPGTTREVVLPILERSGLKCGTDFFLAFSPERVDPGNTKHTTRNTPKLVGGVTPESTSLAALLYQQMAVDVVSVSCPEVAEMTKVFENVFRSVNIALANELAQLCERLGISVWEVIRAAATKPFGYMPFYPGPGVGGHCIPLDPYYLAKKAMEYDFHTRFIELAAGINEEMPYHVTSRVMEALNKQGKSLKGSHVIVLGVSYKKDVDDARESPSLKLINLLKRRGANVSYNDPHVQTVRHEQETLVSVDLTDDVLSSSDCVIIATDHSKFDYKKIVTLSPLIFDTRGSTIGLEGENIVRLGE